MNKELERAYMDIYKGIRDAQESCLQNVCHDNKLERKNICLLSEIVFYKGVMIGHLNFNFEEKDGMVTIRFMFLPNISGE